MEKITVAFMIWTIIIWIAYDVFALYKGYSDGVKTKYTISYQIAKKCKENIFVEILFILALGILIGHFLWPQSICL